MFTFNHVSHGVETELIVRLIPTALTKLYETMLEDNEQDGFVEIEIYDEKGHIDRYGETENEVGKIEGYLRFDGDNRNFYVGMIINRTEMDKRGESSIPRAVGATIAQLLKRGIITAWHSSNVTVI